MSHDYIDPNRYIKKDKSSEPELYDLTDKFIEAFEKL